MLLFVEAGQGFFLRSGFRDWGRLLDAASRHFGGCLRVTEYC